MANKLELKLKQKIAAPNSGIMKKLEAVPGLKRWGVTAAAVEAGAGPIVKRARQLAPRGNQADRDKRSARQRGAADWDYPLWKTIIQVVRKYGANRGLAVVGPEHPKGNKAYFDTSPSGRKVWYWGRDSGQTKAQIRNWIVKAFDETRPQQLRAMEVSIKRSMDKIWKGKM